MKIGILQCGAAREEFQAEHGDYPAMLAELLLQVDAALSFATYRVFDGELPESVDACDVYLTTGSRWSVNDEEPWIAALLQFLASLHRAHKKVFGICFGHQAMAKALGGRVEKAAQGWGVGILQNSICASRPWMIPPRQDIKIVASHQDQVIELPAGAQRLASSDFCPNYMFAIDDTFVGIQGHPEFSTAYASDLLQTRRELMAASTFDAAVASLHGQADAKLLATWMVNFFRGRS